MIVFTASVQQYGDPVIDMLDPLGCVKERLFRSVCSSPPVGSVQRLNASAQSCVNQHGNFVKDLSVLNKDLSQVIIIDNSPIAYALNPRTSCGAREARSP